MTPTYDYENSDFYLKSDTPFGRKPKLIRLRRCRGMRHTEVIGIALMGCVAHRNKQDICVPQMSEPTARAVGILRGHPLTPGRIMILRKKVCY